MRWWTTAGTWARREAILAAALGVGAATVALGVSLGASWLGVVGLAIAAGGALAQMGIAAQRARTESTRERTESERLLRVPVAPVAQVDPLHIGVDRAEQTILPGAGIPMYVAREADARLREALAAALDGSGRWIMVVHGPSKVGKSRSLFEALRACSGSAALDLIAPVDGHALKALLTPGVGLRRGSGAAVLWLDDLEPFLNTGVTLQTLREWHAGRAGRIVAATYGGKGSELVVGSGTAGLATIANEVLQHAREIALGKTTPVELFGLRGAAAGPEAAELERHGLAAYVVAGPALERKLNTGVHAAGEAACSEGVAVVRAAVDWARCGRTDPIAPDTLRQLWPSYLPPGAASSDEGFRVGLAWALRPVAGSIALLQEVSSYTAFDYVVRLVRDQRGADPPREASWVASIDTATDAQALGVATTAYAMAAWMMRCEPSRPEAGQPSLP